jgi:electron transfer flavoprotein beta subunit
MKLVIIYKWARDPADAHVGADGSVDWRDAATAASDDDPAAAQIAVELAGADDEIVGLTVGEAQASWVLARGAARTVVLTGYGSQTSSSEVAAIMAAAIRRIGDVDVILIGDSAWDDAVGACVGGQLSWPVLAGVSASSLTDGRILASRRLGGATEVVEVQPPVVLAVAARMAEQQPPGMKQILAARRKPVEQWSVSELDVTDNATAEIVGTRLPDAPPGHLFDGADAPAAAGQLVAALRSDGALSS